MKLKNGYTYQPVGGAVMAVPTDGDFEGIIKNNPTGNYIMHLLENDVTEEAIVAAMCEKYDAPRSIIEEDVKRVLAALADKGLLE